MKLTQEQQRDGKEISGDKEHFEASGLLNILDDEKANELPKLSARKPVDEVDMQIRPPLYPLLLTTIQIKMLKHIAIF